MTPQTHGTPATCKWPTPGEHKPRTFHEHDLIEVLVRENSRRSARRNSPRSGADLNAGINQWPNFRALLNEQLSPNYTQAQGLPTIAGTIQNRHETEGELSAKTRLPHESWRRSPKSFPTATYSRSPIGHRGRWRAQRDCVRGRCRAEDVSQLNTVYSTQLHDLEVTQHSEGELRRASSKPWITRLLESVFGV